MGWAGSEEGFVENLIVSCLKRELASYGLNFDMTIKSTDNSIRTSR